ncbi:ribonuclease H-like domain-containing protein, partial [Favolaschia claudopus]
SVDTDAWTSPNHRAFVAVGGHWEEDGKRINCLLDFVEVPKSHTGENLADVLHTVVDDFGIADRLISITCDNASPNDTMCQNLENRLDGFNAEKNRTRCFDHVGNLVAKSLLKMFDAPKKKGEGSEPAAPGDGDRDEDEANDGLDLDELLAELNDMERTDDDSDDVFDELAQMLEEDREQFLEQTKEIRSALIKVCRLFFMEANKFNHRRQIRTVAKKTINSSTLLLPAWKEVVKNCGLSAKNLPRDVRTRWNSTYDMIVVALQYRRAIREFTSDESNGLQQFMLTSLEWTVLEDLRYILGVRHSHIFFFNCAHSTNLVIQRRHPLLLSRLGNTCNRYPRHGQA